MPHPPPPDYGATPRHPCEPSLNARAMLPALRVHTAAVQVECLAVAVAHNTMQAAHWLAMTWGLTEYPTDPAHPYRVAALDPTSPPGRMAEAAASLHDACVRYPAKTGDDGMACARAVIVRRFGATLAELALAPIEYVRERLWGLPSEADHALAEGIDGLLDGAGDTAPAPPTPDELAAAVATMVGVLSAGPGMTAVRARLDELQRLPAPDGADSPPADRSALQAVEVACQAAFTAGNDLAAMRGAVDFWADATGGPRVTLHAWRVGGASGQPLEGSWSAPAMSASIAGAADAVNRSTAAPIWMLTLNPPAPPAGMIWPGA